VTDAFHELAAYTALPRLTGLTLSVDGQRLVAVAQEPDAKRARYVSALWEIPLGGGDPVRLTRSEKGETGPAFRPDGSLLFNSTRPDPDAADDAEDEAGLWCLPVRGEPGVVASRAGGLGPAVVASGTGAVVLTGRRLANSTDADDAQRRSRRKERKADAILHSGMPIRHWDHELGAEVPRLLHLADPDGELRDLVPDARAELVEAEFSISADGRTVATTWRTPRPFGRTPRAVHLIDVESGERRVLAAADGVQFTSPAIAPDAARVAVSRQFEGTFDTPLSAGLAVIDTATGDLRLIELGDLNPVEWVWSADSRTVFVAGDLQGRGAVVAVDPHTATVTRRLAADAVYSNLCPAPDGAALYALRSAHDWPATPVRLDPRADDQVPVFLPTPAPKPELPGVLEEITVDVDGAAVHGWLARPPDGAPPAPVMLWIHGGPFLSSNAWNWRWNPWVAVAHGWAVVMPDPALSTGYGQSCIDRAWPYRADVVWREAAAVLDAALERPGLDPARLALCGGSFGGFMTNWIAGHTDRFAAIVTHAGLWALDQQHATTDNAEFKTGIFGRLADHPDWYAAYSPHNFADEITTPMLVVHGNRDYRVPVGEALRLWWDLVSRWSGAPDDMPHRFLQFPGENHWILGPANAQIWYETVLGFCAQHVLDRPWTPPELL